jgi:hypothetical protein
MKDGGVSTLVEMVLEALSKVVLSEYLEFLVSSGLCGAIGKIVHSQILQRLTNCMLFGGKRRHDG